MTERRQAQRQGKQAATSFSLALILSLFSSPSSASEAQAALVTAFAGARQTLFVLLLVLLSAVTLILCRYRRRDVTSPRRIGRRI
jgi:hypothetical protein